MMDLSHQRRMIEVMMNKTSIAVIAGAVLISGIGLEITYNVKSI
jgi:TRAP-type uncharacterized transport system fused permease subunit